MAGRRRSLVPAIRGTPSRRGHAVTGRRMGRMDENLSIFKKGLFLVGIPLLAQLLFLAMLLKIRSDEDEAQHWAMHTKDVMVRAEGAFRLASRANSDLRAFAVSGNPQFGEAYLHDRVQVVPALEELREVVHDSTAQQ